MSVHAEPAGQRVPDVELAALSRLESVSPFSRLPLSIRDGSPTLLRVLSDNRDDGRQFAFCREVSSDVRLRCFRQSHQEVFNAFETTAMVDFLLLRLKGALQEPWLEDVTALRRAIVVGSVEFAGFRDVVSKLLSVWAFVRDYVRHTCPHHIRIAAERVSFIYFFVEDRNRFAVVFLLMR